MKRTILATLGIGLGSMAVAPFALAQVTSQEADFSPPPPATLEAPDATRAAPADPGAAPMYPGAAPTYPAAEAPAQPATIEAAPPAMELAPPPAADPRAHEPTRTAAPDAHARHDRDPNPQTGPYLGHGLFNDRGPNDFGA